MYDTGKIVVGIIIFLAIFLIPFYASLISGEADEVPEPVFAPEAKEAGQCVESAEVMRAEHMKMLVIWRDEVVRGANRDYVSNEYGIIYDKSLTDTCLEQCHTNKSEFCDQCHEYASVEPGCWSCHNVIDNSAEGD